MTDGDGEAGGKGRIVVAGSLSIGRGEIEEKFVRASGPGGQNVNKVSSAVQLRFDARRSPSLPSMVRARLEKLAGRRLTRDGVIVISAMRHRRQEMNRADALDILLDLIRRAMVAPVARVPTRPTRASGERRLAAKRINAERKRDRSGAETNDH